MELCVGPQTVSGVESLGTDCRGDISNRALYMYVSHLETFYV
jgi:hypothetical protein